MPILERVKKRRLKGLRTLIFNFIAAIPLAFDVLMQILMSEEFKAVIPAEWLPYYGLAILIANMILRAITTTPMGRAE